jgi:hypothetical protein
VDFLSRHLDGVVVGCFGAIAAFGAWHCAWRMIRLGPNQVDAPLPPTVLEELRGRSGLAPLNPAFFDEAQQRAIDNVRSFVGVWLTIAGGVIGSAGPFLLETFWLGRR